MAKSPAKFGLGEYSDEPFELKSGNTPIFKRIGSSPYEQEEGEGEEGSGQGWKKVLGLVGEMALSGLDAVYGTGKVVSGSGRLTKKGDKEKECPVGYKRNAEGNCEEIGKVENA